MFKTTTRSAHERREEIQARATAMGIDDAYISMLVDSFYANIQKDDLLGPVFAKHIKDWDKHLPIMKAFWSSVALNTGKYSGRPMPAHFKLRDEVTPEHFTKWLQLFKITLEETGANSDAIEYFMIRAERIAKSLQLTMFGDPDLPMLKGSPLNPAG